MNGLQQQIKEAFMDKRKHPYRLHAAFFHRGTATGGHYWVYIYDHKKELWRKYNDDRVNTVDNRNEIFGQPIADAYAPPNPYFLVYVRQDQIGELVETVKRDIVYSLPEQPPPMPARSQMSEMPPLADVEMQEYPGGSGVNGGEQHFPHAPAVGMHRVESHHPPDPIVPKEGDWDDSELMADTRINW